MVRTLVQMKNKVNNLKKAFGVEDPKEEAEKSDLK
jgi:hypothetical protein